MSNHDLIVFLLGSLSGFSLMFFIFARWYSEQHKSFTNSLKSQVADARRIALAEGYKNAFENVLKTKDVTKL